MARTSSSIDEHQQQIDKVIHRINGTCIKRVSLKKPPKGILRYFAAIPKQAPKEKMVRVPAIDIQVRAVTQNGMSKTYWVLKTTSKDEPGRVRKQLFLDSQEHPTAKLLEKAKGPIAKKHLGCCTAKFCKATRCLEALRKVNKSAST
ncbi:hypothetical protein TWF506_001813 [Arthrobotrys conoides]|uniref:Uncharacterized protein n=1 Tax=Arthrobotrys conoides TaxID=74498 RepID=A0AAN8NY60_9PEZI